MAASTPENALRFVSRNESFTCSICLDELNNGLTHEPDEKITHLFHEACLANLSNCPNCRVEFTKPVTETDLSNLPDAVSGILTKQVEADKPYTYTPLTLKPLVPVTELHRSIEEQSHISFLHLMFGPPAVLTLSNGDEEWKYTDNRSDPIEYNFCINKQGLLIGYRKLTSWLIGKRTGGMSKETIGCYFNREPVSGTRFIVPSF